MHYLSIRCKKNVLWRRRTLSTQLFSNDRTWSWILWRLSLQVKSSSNNFLTPWKLLIGVHEVTYAWRHPLRRFSHGTSGTLFVWILFSRSPLLKCSHKLSLVNCEKPLWRRSSRGSRVIPCSPWEWSNVNRKQCMSKRFDSLTVLPGWRQRLYMTFMMF